MKKILLFLCIIPIFISAQNVDTIITTPMYKSYYSYKTHTPLFVSYILYKGGGNCSRKGMTFKSDKQLQTATYSDYDKSGYDIGHMANAEDFAFDCDKERMTFDFINTLPQTARLNRGEWKILETSLRKLSQTDSLLIVCGGYGFNKKIGKVLVPKSCFKIVKNLRTDSVNVYVFLNDNNPQSYQEPVETLLNDLPFAEYVHECIADKHLSPQDKTFLKNSRSDLKSMGIKNVW